MTSLLLVLIVVNSSEALSRSKLNSAIIVLTIRCLCLICCAIKMIRIELKNSRLVALNSLYVVCQCTLCVKKHWKQKLVSICTHPPGAPKQHKLTHQACSDTTKRQALPSTRRDEPFRSVSWSLVNSDILQLLGATLM